MRANKSTRISGIGSDRDVSQSYTYDDLDQMSDIAYPNTTTYGSPAWFHLQPKRNYGFLTRLDPDASQPGFTPLNNEISYSANGSVNFVPHNNGVTDTYTPDNGMARPKSIAFSGWSGGCTAPTFGSIQSSNGSSLTYGQSTNLFISADGHGESPTYQWYLGQTAIGGATLPSYTVVPNQNSNYSVRVANSCGYADSAAFAITVQLSAPTNLIAGRDPSVLRINVSWQQSAGATGYDIWRRSAGGWSKLNLTPIPSAFYQDNVVGSDAAYVYNAVAVGTNVVPSVQSNNDVANTYIYPSVSAGQTIYFSDFDRVLQHGINNLLIATGNPTRSWHDIDNVSGVDCAISAPDPDPVNHSPILAAHMLALRCAMNRALASAVIPLISYTDSNLANVLVKAIHINELQNRTK